jgi:hypothetical protein
MALLGMGAPAATAAHLVAVQGMALGMPPALEIAPPPTDWGAKEIALGLVHYLIYAVATSDAFEFLDRQSECARLAA